MRVAFFHPHNGMVVQVVEASEKNIRATADHLDHLGWVEVPPDFDEQEDLIDLSNKETGPAPAPRPESILRLETPVLTPGARARVLNCPPGTKAWLEGERGHLASWEDPETGLPGSLGTIDKGTLSTIQLVSPGKYVLRVRPPFPHRQVTFEVTVSG